nr:fructose bisphosphate aldolase [Tsuneonella mangrovi]
MTETIERGSGFIAALDQSGGSTPNALRNFGVDPDAWENDEEMFALIHEMRCRILSSPCFSGDRVLGAILFEGTMAGEVDGVPVPRALNDRGIVPFVKVDKGLDAEEDGVRLMKPIADLDALLLRARKLGVFGTKARSLINEANRSGIVSVVRQQFELARCVLEAGLVPIVEPEVNIASPERCEADCILLEVLLDHLDRLPNDARVILKLSLPAKVNHFEALTRHERVMRVVALSGGYTRGEACAELISNRGIIASFSRALLQDLRASMSDAEFDASLDVAVAEIFEASMKQAA